jgi:hypothetical protein
VSYPKDPVLHTLQAMASYSILIKFIDMFMHLLCEWKDSVVVIVVVGWAQFGMVS